MANKLIVMGIGIKGNGRMERDGAREYYTVMVRLLLRGTGYKTSSQVERSKASTMKVGGTTTLSTGKGCISSEMGVTTKAIGKTMRRMEMGFTITAMVILTKVSL